MWEISHSVIVKADANKIWNIWNKPEQWPTWDSEVKSCKLHGEFKQGSVGKLIPKGGPGVKFEITALTPNKSFTDVARLPFAQLIFVHDMRELEPNVMEVTHTVKIIGKLAWFFSRVMGKQIANGLPHALKNLALQAEGC